MSLLQPFLYAIRRLYTLTMYIEGYRTKSVAVNADGTS